jgi:hypothetical protein
MAGTPTECSAERVLLCGTEASWPRVVHLEVK